MKNIIVSDLFGQEIKVGAKALYIRTSCGSYITLCTIVTDIKARARTKNDTQMYGSPPVVQIALDCGDLWGIKKIRDSTNLIMVEKLSLDKWQLGSFDKWRQLGLDNGELG